MADVTGAVVSNLMDLFTNKNQTVTKTIDPNLTAQFNDIIMSLMPNVKSPVVNNEELDQLFQSAFFKGQKAFAPNQALQASVGGYDSTALEALKNDAMAKALNEGISTILDTKLKANSQQTEAANVAGSLVNNQSAVTAQEKSKSGSSLNLQNIGTALLSTFIPGCYITTATMEATGNSDDNSYELATMRQFRDGFMKATPAGQELIDNYYQVAPKVVAKLNARSDAKHVYTAIYNNYLAPAIAAIETGDNYHALSIYRAMSQYAESLANQK